MSHENEGWVYIRYTVTILCNPIKDLLPYWFAVVCQALLSFMTWKIYARKRVRRILYGELPEGSSFICDAARAAEYNAGLVPIRKYGEPFERDTSALRFAEFILLEEIIYCVILVSHQSNIYNNIRVMATKVVRIR